MVTVGFESFGARSDAMTIDQRARPADILSHIGSSPSLHGRRERPDRLLRYCACSPVPHRGDLDPRAVAR
jgi:hypothetical protein